jgi:hypothetical protein
VIFTPQVACRLAPSVMPGCWRTTVPLRAMISRLGMRRTMRQAQSRNHGAARTLYDMDVHSKSCNPESY